MNFDVFSDLTLNCVFTFYLSCMKNKNFQKSTRATFERIIKIINWLRFLCTRFRCYTYDNATSRTAISPTQLANEAKPSDTEENGDVKPSTNVTVFVQLKFRKMSSTLTCEKISVLGESIRRSRIDCR